MSAWIVNSNKTETKNLPCCYSTSRKLPERMEKREKSLIPT